ncbi:hypothetical protein MIN45_P2074 [Methylomarinovum tepidoasis]|uniref:Glycosyltransferase 2-like domain-containing protein n=1 Tax=Methylomarinovum tepidoasis TaxID=2840183 RepID=A0AAU9CFS6_9GAMM|nr:glycosyltransferase [Methylomarinovum sp. IN45]BCX89701.1 hypothetical protein MIN45_P2074 [Methylomarinovum sp. IN45]
MRISVVIPAYNAAPFLEKALESVQAQTHPVAEILVVDDGSTDATADIARSFPQVRYLRQQNQGPSAARNRGIQEARGDWIAFLDADDRWTPEKTSEQLAALRRYPQLALIASDMAETDSDGNVRIASMLAHHGLRDDFVHFDGAPVPDALSRLVRKNFIPTGTVLVRREVLQQTGTFDPDLRYGEDLELWARIAARHPVTCLPRVHMLRCRHGRNATDNTDAMLEDLIRVMDSIRRHCAAELKRQGTDPDELVAQALWTLGYWHFSHDHPETARPLFLRSLQEKFAVRTLAHWLASRLPARWIPTARQLWQHLHGT